LTAWKGREYDAVQSLMATFLLRRVAEAAVLVFLVLTLTFFFIRLVPGDPTAAFEDPQVPRAQQEALRQRYGLDRAIVVQYGRWLRAVAVDLDWGTSFISARPAMGVILESVPSTLLLTGCALLLQFGAGLALGVGAARRPGSHRDHWIRIGGLLLYALPTFWIAVMSVLLLSHLVPLFPAGQMHSVGAARLSAPERWLDLLHHLVLPVLVLGLASTGSIVRQARASLLESLGQEYIRTARAKGLSERRVVWVHGLRNALSPLIQLLGLSLPFLLSGALVVEVVFAWPGMGRVTFDAMRARDYPVILAGTCLAALLVVAGNFAADLLQAWADPRVRHDA
jgi:peptide/nickel transport system permease protein